MSHHRPLADIDFITKFAAFCRTKGDEAYDYYDINNCAVAQFVKASGLCSNVEVGGFYWHDLITGEKHELPENFVAECEEPYIFSALADRLEALIADAPLVTS